MTQPTTGMCQCGCGQPAPVAQRNEDGYLKGEPKRFILGHSTRNEGAPWWKGDDASYGAIHAYLRKHFPKSGACDECGITGKRTEYALIKGREYSRSRGDYRELCKRCHNAYDEIGGSRWKGVATARSLAPEQPVCGCGCAELVPWDHSHKRWRRFMPGHYAGAMRRTVQGLPPVAPTRMSRAPRPRTSASHTSATPTLPRDGRSKSERRTPAPGPAPRTPINCVQCGTQFPPKHKRALFCSKACKAAARRAAGTDDMERTCHVCGGTFTSNKYDEIRHCSHSCGATCQHAGGCLAAA